MRTFVGLTPSGRCGRLGRGRPHPSVRSVTDAFLVYVYFFHNFTASTPLKLKSEKDDRPTIELEVIQPDDWHETRGKYSLILGNKFEGLSL